METEKKEPLQVVGVEIPNPGWTHSIRIEGVPFGVHYATLKKERHDWEVASVCNGELRFFDIDKSRNTLCGLAKDPVEIRCLKCGFCLPFKNWNEAVFEWMRIVFGTTIRQIIHCPPGSNLTEKQILAHVIDQEIKVCNPQYWIAHFNEELLNRIDEIAWGEKDIEFFPIVWENYGLVIARIFDLDCDGLKFILADAGILMTAMERSFQEAIKRAAQLASSASESFHPDTRRNK